MKITQMSAKCFLCDKNKGGFDTEQRVCNCKAIKKFSTDERNLYVTVLPDPREYDVSALPSIYSEKFTDIFAVSPRTTRSSRPATAGLAEEKVTQRLEPAYFQRAMNNFGERGTLPLYAPDHLHKDFGLRCGNPIIYSIPRLGEWAGFSEVNVLDMGTYLWSGTLKDPRSWAIINTALHNGITDLALWTAGNAGLSLGRLAYAVNRSLPAKKRLRIYGLVDSEVSPEVITKLRAWQCDVLDLPTQTKYVINPEKIKKLVQGKMTTRNQRLYSKKYWHVTDGWDGVGLLMYRFLAAQVIRDVKPVYVVAPVGTGDLLLGLYQGLADCERTGSIAEGSCKLIGVVPAGENVLDNIRNQRIRPDAEQLAPQSDKIPPVMPKLIGRYTPLAPCIHRLESEKKVTFVEVSANDQLTAGGHILNGGADIGVACEPSALATFAALPYVSEIAREHESGAKSPQPYSSRSRILVINSGLGVLSNAEEDVLLKSFSK